MAKKKKRGPGRPKKVKALSAQQKQFCLLWVANFNLADAWIGAKNKVKSRAVAKAAASRFLLTNVNAQTYCGKLLEKQQGRAEKSADDVVREMEALAFSNIQDFVDTDGDGEFIFKDWQNMSREKLAAVESVKVTTNTTRGKDETEYTTKNIQFKLYSKISALENLAKRFNVFPNKTEVKVQGETPSVIIIGGAVSEPSPGN